MSDKNIYTTEAEAEALEALYAMPVGAIVLHDFTMYTKEDDDEWITALDANTYDAEHVVAAGLPLERIDLDPQMRDVVEQDAYDRAERAEREAEDRF